MDSLPGAEKAGEHLKRTCLRDFGPAPDNDEREDLPEKSWRLAFGPHDAPVPPLLKYALNLIGLEAGGPGEKVAWWVNFTYKGEWCELAHQKFGLRLYLWTDRPAGEARKTLAEIARKLQASTRTVEKLILASAPRILGQGDATVVNQHRPLRRAYEYFRERATDPVFIDDEQETGETEFGTWSSFKSGKTQMQMNAFHDMVAAISAYISLLEHDLVLALAFTDFDPAQDDLTKVIGNRWGEKFIRVLGKDGDAGTYRQRLADVVERWRNPYSHGGFEKGHGATIYLHTPGVGAAVPVGLTGIRTSPLFSFLPAGESDVTEVFDLFDEIDEWLTSELPHAVQWMNSGLAMRFDEPFRRDATAAKAAGRFDHFMEMHSYRQDMLDNMDF